MAQGFILNWTATADGVIRGQDGARYAFATADWKSEGTPGNGDTVDFEVRDGRAVEIYLLKRADTSQGSAGASAAATASAALKSVGSQAGQMARRLQANAGDASAAGMPEWLFELLRRPVAFYALVLLLATLVLNYVGVASAFDSGGLGFWTLTFLTLNDDWSALSGLLSNSRQDGLSLATDLQLLNLLVPFFAVLLIFRELTGGARRITVVALSLASLVVLLIVPMIFVLVMNDLMGTSRSGGGAGPRFGWWAFLALEIVLLLSAFGVVPAPLGNASGRKKPKT